MLRVQSKLLLLSFLAAPLLCLPGLAAPVPDLYVAQVPTTALSGGALEEAFDRALDAVLVKVTGQQAVAASSALRRAVGPAGPLVRKYQPGAGGRVRVSFDPGALRRRLDAANLPVWADDRPRTLVILAGGLPSGPATPSGGIVSAGPVTGPVTTPASSAGQLLIDTAASRGVPVVLASGTGAEGPGADDPLVDPEATARAAGANLVLLGRRAPSAGPAVFRWTLLQGSDRSEWQGDAAAGANGLADRLAARYAITAAMGRVIRIRIDGVDSFDAYGRLQSYLRSVDLIQSADLQRVSVGALFFELAVRGDVNRLNDAFALQRLLEPVGDFSAAEPVYRLVMNASADALEAP